MIFNPAWADAISSIESGGNYGILGPVTRSGDRAYGRYQVMGSNVGPWTKEALGKALTPQQFLASPTAQDAVFQSRFGKYAQKYGPEGAARAWFAGEGGMNNPNAKDSLGTSVASYASKFTNALGGAPQSQTTLTQPSQSLQPMPLTPRVGSPGLGALGGLLAMMPQQQLAQQEPELAPPRPPPRRRIDTSGLAALLQDAPPSVRGLLFQG